MGYSTVVNSTIAARLAQEGPLDWHDFVQAQLGDALHPAGADLPNAVAESEADVLLGVSLSPLPAAPRGRAASAPRQRRAPSA